jgi:hypothetical protein
MTEIGTDWRVVDGVATAWFDAPSLIEGAALAGRIADLSAEIVVDLRATGMQIRLDSCGHAEAVSAAARDLGLAVNPAVLQQRSRCRPTSRRPPCHDRRSRWPSLTSRRIAGGSPTPKATSWRSSAGHELALIDLGPRKRGLPRVPEDTRGARMRVRCRNAT